MASISPPARFIIISAAAVILIAGMKSAQTLLVPFLLSIFLTIVIAPQLFWFKQRGLPTWLSMTIIVGVVSVLGIGFAAVIGSSVNDFSQSLPEYQAKLKTIITGHLEWVRSFGITVPDKILLEHFDPSAAMKLVANMLSELSGVLTNAFLILLAVVFMLLEATSFQNKIKIGFNNSKSVSEKLQGVAKGVQQYIALKTLISILTGIAIGIWLLILGVDYPLLWGLLAFLLNYVPNLGSIIAAVPAVLLALIQIGPYAAILSGAGYVVVNVIVGNVIEPKFMGKGLGLSSLVVFLSLVFWGWVLGPVGMLLSVPLTMAVKIALENSSDTRWMAVLLGPDVYLESDEES